MTYVNPDGSPLPTLVDFRVTPKNTLILFLQVGEAHYTRRIKLGTENAGMYVWHPDGDALIARGRSKKPQVFKFKGQEDIVHYPLVGAFPIRADVELLRQLALATWGHTGEPPAREDVRADTEYPNAAD